MKRKICIIKGSRGEYGQLRPLLQEIKRDAALKLQLIATGMHLCHDYGLTYKEIEQDGFIIDEKIKMFLGSDTADAIAKSMGFAMIGFSKAYTRLKPDIIIVLGDRFEILSAVSTALVNRIPVAHICGGEITEGSFDDAIRHSITKMSHLHFTTIDEYRKRVIQLGEDPKLVFKVGSLTIDNIKKLELLSKEALQKELNFKFNKRSIMVTFHPATLENNTSGQQFQALLSVLDTLRNTSIIFTKANADVGGRVINKMIDEYVLKNRYRAVAFASLGTLKYLSSLQFVDAIVGNSSSGIIEAPSFKIGTINIGDRQKGRIKPESVIDCNPSKDSIRNAFKKLYSREFQGRLKRIANPYQGGNAAFKIKEIIKKTNLVGIIKKKFYDIKIKNV